jgi:hypothetical protein
VPHDPPPASIALAKVCDSARIISYVQGGWLRMADVVWCRARMVPSFPLRTQGKKKPAVVIMMLSEWVAPLCGGFGDFDPRGTAEIVWSGRRKHEHRNELL